VAQYGTPKDTREMRAKLEDLEQKTSELIRESTVLIKDLGMILQKPNTSLAEDVQRIRKLEHQKLTKDFQLILAKFQQVQRSSAEKSREFVIQAKAQHVQLEEGYSDQDAPLLGGEGKRQLQIKKLDDEIEYNEAIIAEREQSIVDIEHKIHEVNEIFRDLSTLVVEQQGFVDNIEANIESAATRTGDAVGELQSASKYQQSSRTKMCCLFGVFGTILAILVVILVMQKSH
jgi:syntaxin 7